MRKIFGRGNILRVLAIAMAVLLVAAALPVATMAEGETTSANAAQIVNSGGTNTSTDGRVSVSKTIAPTEVENTFDITLEVKTTQNIEEILKAQDMAAVIVMDISNTMVEKTMTDRNGNKSSQYQVAKDAAIQFVQTFCTNSQGLTVNREIALVAFATDAHNVTDGFVNCTNASASDSLTKKINGLDNMKLDGDIDILDSKYSSSSKRFTNIEAGLRMAQNLLADRNENNKYIIFLSDGFPTTYIQSDASSTDTIVGWNPVSDSGTPGTDGVFYDSATGRYCLYGTSYSDKAAQRAQDEAQRIKNAGTKIYSIGINIDGQNIDNLERNGRNGVEFSVVDCSHSTTGSCVTQQNGKGEYASNYINWLATKIGSNYYVDGSSYKALEDAYNDIMKDIKTLNEHAVQASWVSTDPIPNNPEGKLEFISFYTKDESGAYVQTNGEYSYADGYTSVSGALKEKADNTASYNADNSSINWDLKKSGYTLSKDGNTTYYTYTLKYRVRLTNEVLINKTGDFVENQAYDTNGTTKLTYRTIDDGIISGDKSIEFPIPSVKGYLCTLNIHKLLSYMSEDGTLTQRQQAYRDGSVKFTLTHNDDCPVCAAIHPDDRSVSIVDMQSMSGTNILDGLTEYWIDNIPSGHTYTLTEQNTDRYLPNNTAYTIVAEYDKIYYIDKDGAKVEITSEAPVTFTNVPLVDVSVSKVWDDDNFALLRGDITVQLFTQEKDAETGKWVLTPVTDADGNPLTAVLNGSTTTASWTNLPGDKFYAVREITALPYYTHSADNDITFSINEDGDYAFTLTNHYPYGSLTVSKTVTGNVGDKTYPFSFEVKLSAPLNGKFGDMTFVNGVAKFTLSHNQSITADYLPAGITYEVTETDTYDHSVSYSGRTGTIVKNVNAQADIVNNKIFLADPTTGNLYISKTVTGNGGDKDQLFTFGIQLSGLTDEQANKSYSGVQFTDGYAEIQLSHGQSKVILSLPEGTTYSVTELDGDGYTTTIDGDASGTIVGGERANVNFTNHKDKDDTKTGSLTVTKTIRNADGTLSDDIDTTFLFTIELDCDLSGTYGDLTFKNGVAAVKLGQGGSVTASGLPVGIGYSVSEETPEGWTMTSTGADGTITEVGATAKFTNKVKDTETTKPDETTTPKVTDTTVPQDTTTVPEDTTTVPEDTTTVPQDTTTVPEDTTTVPQDTTTVPEDTTTVPQDTTTVPEDTTTVPQDTTNVSKDTTTVPRDTTTPADTSEPDEAPQTSDTGSFVLIAVLAIASLAVAAITIGVKKRRI